MSIITRKTTERLTLISAVVLLGTVVVVAMNMQAHRGGDTASEPAAVVMSEEAERQAIFALMRATSEQPGNALDAGPVAVAGDYAVADWTQGSMGGRALLRKRDGAWVVILCAGDVLKTEEGLRRVSVPEAPARALADQLEELERGVAPERLAAMARFLEIVEMEP